MQQNTAARNEHFVYAFVDNVVSGNDVFDVRFCMWTPSCIQHTKYNYFNVFDVILDWNQVKRKNLDGCRGALKREVFFHTFLCVLV